MMYHKDTYYISVSTFCAAMEELPFRKVKPLLKKRPYAQNFDWVRKWYLLGFFGHVLIQERFEAPQI